MIYIIGWNISPFIFTAGYSEDNCCRLTVDLKVEQIQMQLVGSSDFAKVFP